MTNRLKLAAAGIGTAAVVAMGALGVAFTPESDGTQTFGEAPDMTLGETTTEPVGVTEIETSLAVPEVTAEAAPEA